MLRSKTALWCCVLWVSCTACRTPSEAAAKSVGDQHDERDHQAVHAASEPSNPAQALVQAYIQLQTKLAQDDGAGAKRAFAAVSSAAKHQDLALDPSRRQGIERACGQGAAAGDLKAARHAFAALTAELLSWVEAAKNPLSKPLVIAYCPMAFDGKGGKWLQLGEKIQNPYFGAEMLTCGNVDKTLAPREPGQ